MTSSHGVPVIAAAAMMTNVVATPAFDGDDDPASVSDGEADVDDAIAASPSA